MVLFFIHLFTKHARCVCAAFGCCVQVWVWAQRAKCLKTAVSAAFNGQSLSVIRSLSQALHRAGGGTGKADKQSAQQRVSPGAFCVLLFLCAGLLLSYCSHTKVHKRCGAWVFSFSKCTAVKPSLLREKAVLTTTLSSMSLCFCLVSLAEKYFSHQRFDPS